MNPGCPRCGGTMIGDGYKSVRHCENSTEESYFYADPDRGPIYCDMNQTNEPICHPAEPCEHIPQCKASNQTPEELAEQLAKRLATEHLPHPFELSALPLILSAIQSATQSLVQERDRITARVKELETALQHSAGTTERLTAENAALRKLLRAVLDEHNKSMREASEIDNSDGPYMPPSITLRIRQAIDQARNQ
jgi:hypothetical protein